MKPTFVRCPLADVVRLHGCYHQAGASLARGFGRQSEVRTYLKARGTFYDLPPFLLATCPSASCIDNNSVLKKWEDSSLAHKIKLYSIYSIVGIANRFRHKTVLLPPQLLLYLHSTFRRLQDFLDSDSDDFPDVVNLSHHLHDSFGLLDVSAGSSHFAKAQRIEHFNQASRETHYSFEEILTDE